MGGLLARERRPAFPTPHGKPAAVDLRAPGGCYPYPTVADQGEELSCVTECFLTALYCARARRGLALFPASGVPRLNGARVHAASIAESNTPRIGATFSAVLAHLKAAYGEDMRAMGVRLIAVPADDVEAMREHLRSGRFLVVGYYVNEAIRRFHEDAAACAARGFRLPDFSEDPHCVSGHTVLVLGYSDAAEAFVARNSWGEAWGDGGHFYLPYAAVVSGGVGDVVAVA